MPIKLQRSGGFPEPNYSIKLQCLKHDALQESNLRKLGPTSIL